MRVRCRLSTRPCWPLGHRQVAGKGPSCRSWAPSPGKVLLGLHAAAGLRRHHHTLLAMVHAPEAVELRKVHVRLDAAILAGRERVGGPGAEKAPVRAGAAALGVRVGGLQGQGRALAGSTTGANQWWAAASGQPLRAQATKATTRASGQMSFGAEEKSNVFSKL